MSFSPPGASQVKRDGRFWKAINDFLSVFNWHVCSIAHRLWGISCFSWFLYKAERRKCRFLRYGASQVNHDGRFWKAFNDFLLLFNWHFCSITHRLWVISCFHWYLCNRKWRNVDFSARGRRRSIMTIDSEWQPTTSYQCLVDTFALSRTVCEL